MTQKKNQELLDALICQTVWAIKWKTESGDEGIHGAWLHHPSEEEQESFMKKTHSDEWVDDDQFIKWDCIEFTIKEKIGD